MTKAERVGLAALLQTLGRILADRLKHEEPSSRRLPQQALVDQRPERLQVHRAHPLSSFELEAAWKHCEAREESALVLGEQLVAPADRGAERPLPLRRIAGARRQQVRAAESFEDLLRPQDLHPSRGELDRER